MSEPSFDKTVQGRNERDEVGHSASSSRDRDLDRISFEVETIKDQLVELRHTLQRLCDHPAMAESSAKLNRLAEGMGELGKNLNSVERRVPPIAQTSAVILL